MSWSRRVALIGGGCVIACGAGQPPVPPSVPDTGAPVEGRRAVDASASRPRIAGRFTQCEAEPRPTVSPTLSELEDALTQSKVGGCGDLQGSDCGRHVVLAKVIGAVLGCAEKLDTRTVAVDIEIASTLTGSEPKDNDCGETCHVDVRAFTWRGRRWLHINASPIADYVTNVFELVDGRVVPYYSQAAPYVDPICHDPGARPQADTASTRMISDWPSFPTKLREAICYGEIATK